MAPLGFPAPIRTIVDVDLGHYDEAWAAGGHPHYVFPTSFAELLRITNGSPLDVGVRDCIAAKAICRGYELDQRSMRRQRDGNFVTDFLNFRRHTEITGWRFNGVLLLRDGVVVYKLSGGQPSIREQEENTNPLGPLQGIGESRIFR